MAYRRTQDEVNPDDDEIEADSLSIPSFRKMAVAYPDEGEPNMPTALDCQLCFFAKFGWSSKPYSGCVVLHHKLP